MSSNFQDIDIANRDIKAEVRLDIKGVAKPGRFLFGGKPMDKASEEARERQVTLLRNVPIQGIHIDDIDIGTDIYEVYDKLTNSAVAYAPIILKITADSLEDLIKFIIREDFRKIEILSPTSISLHRYDIERLIFTIASKLNEFYHYLERSYNMR